MSFFFCSQKVSEFVSCFWLNPTQLIPPRAARFMRDVIYCQILQTVPSNYIFFVYCLLSFSINLMRNLDPKGLCNGTRMIIIKMERYLLEGKVITSSNNGDKVFIPKLSLSWTDTKIPFKFQRRRFVCFAMIINKSQGLNKLTYTFHNQCSCMINFM